MCVSGKIKLNFGKDLKKHNSSKLLIARLRKRKYLEAMQHVHRIYDIYSKLEI